jgi:hypothetical protein
MAIPQPKAKYESRISGFDESEFSSQSDEPSEGAGVDAVMASLEADEEEPQAEDPELNDVDVRLETADYYRAILKHQFFDVQGPAAEIVDREIRTFIRERLEVLLGLRAAKVEGPGSLPFDEDQVEALTALANKVLGRPALLSGEPTVKKMAAPGAKPEIKPAAKPKPQVKKIPVPAPAPSSKPKVKQPPPQREAAPAQKQPVANSPQKQAPATMVEPGVEGGITQTYISREGQRVTLVEGEIIEENGRRYQVVANGVGTLFRKDITGQVVPPNRIPPMSPQQMSVMSQQLAEQQLGMMDEITGMAVISSLSNK